MKCFRQKFSVILYGSDRFDSVVINAHDAENNEPLHKGSGKGIDTQLGTENFGCIGNCNDRR